MQHVEGVDRQALGLGALVTFLVVGALVIGLVVARSSGSTVASSSGSSKYIAFEGTHPGAPDTGVPDGVKLVAGRGGVISSPSTSIDGRLISEPLVIEAPGVVIRNTRIVGAGSDVGITVRRGGSVTISDSDISGFETGIVGDEWTAVRLDINGMTGDGVKVGSNVTLADSWIHDLRPAGGAHADGVQMQAGVSNLTIRHNTIVVAGAANAALFLAPDLGPSSEGPVLVEGNLLGGGNYTLYCVDGANGRYTVGNITIRDNVFTNDSRYGPASVTVPLTWEGNTMAVTGVPI